MTASLKVCRKRFNVGWLCAAKPVDGLALIGNDPRRTPSAADFLQHPRACKVDVLVFVDENMLEARNVGADLLVLFDQLCSKENNISEVHSVGLLECLLVYFVG